MSSEQIKFNTPENQNLEILIEEAKKHALPKHEFLELIKRRAILMAQPFNENNMSKVREIDKVFLKSMIVVDNLYNFKKLLELIIEDEDKVKKILAHENAHGNVADSVGLHHKGYIIGIMKNDDGYFCVPAAEAIFTNLDEFPLSPAEMLKMQIAMAEGPQIHGEKLSRQDKEIIDELRRQLEQLGEK